MKKETCLRCGHEFVKRMDNPKVCPKCHSAWWQTPKKQKKEVEGEK